MARVEVTSRALRDLERLFEFIAIEDPSRARQQLISVRRAFELFADHPLLGRSAEQGRRELVLSRGRFGYIAKSASPRAAITLAFPATLASRWLPGLFPDARG